MKARPPRRHRLWLSPVLLSAGLAAFGCTEDNPYFRALSDAGESLHDRGLRPEVDAQPGDGDASEPRPRIDGGPPCEGPRCDRDDDGFTVEDGDCDDTNPRIYPGAPELCDGLDNNCDGVIDNFEESCFEGTPEQMGVGICLPGRRRCVEGQWGACAGQVLPEPEDLCGDGLDNDCDGRIDQGCDLDRDGFTIEDGDCDDNNPAVHPGAPEICNGIDDDCDGVIDELREPCYDGPGGTLGVGRCAVGWRVCREGQFGGCEGQVLPEGELCGNGVDDNCDGRIDEGCGEACDIDLNSTVKISSSCMSAGSSAHGLIVVNLIDSEGRPLPNHEVEISAQGPLSLFRQERHGHQSYLIYGPTGHTGEGQLSVRATCGNGQRVMLHTQPTVQVVPAQGPTGDLVTGGCEQISGALRVIVTDGPTGQPLPGAVVMVGAHPQPASFVNNPLRALLGQSPDQPNVAYGNEAGAVLFRDLADNLRGPQLLTVGAPGYRYVTLQHLEANLVHVPLWPIEPPQQPAQTITGAVSTFDNMEDANSIKFALVQPPLRFDELPLLHLDRLSQRSTCWTLTDWNVGGLLNKLTPGNLYAPPQAIQYGSRTPLNEHRYTLFNQPLIERPVVALGGALGAQAFISRYLAAANIQPILAELSYTRIGLLNPQASPDQGEVPPIFLTHELQQRHSCEVSGLPSQSDVLCGLAGRWRSGPAEGELFLMGLARGQMGRSGPLTLPLSSVPAEGPFREIEYVAAAVARSAQGVGTSAVLQQMPQLPELGTFSAQQFLPFLSLQQSGRQLSWAATGGNNQALSPQLCRLEILQITQQNYSPGECSYQVFTERREDPLWQIWLPRNPSGFTLPTLPSELPDPLRRPAPGGTRTLEMRVQCMRFDEAEAYNFNRSDFGQLPRRLTHQSTATR